MKTSSIIFLWTNDCTFDGHRPLEKETNHKLVCGIGFRLKLAASFTFFLVHSTRIGGKNSESRIHSPLVFFSLFSVGEITGTKLRSLLEASEIQ